MKQLCAVIILTLAIAASAVWGGSPALAAVPTPTPEPTPAGERIDWNRCGSLECGSIQVPADYRDPEAGSIRIAVNVHRATSPEKRIGYLLVNPGGPGASGTLYVFENRARFSDAIIEHFDIVGFDPRGVGVSDKLVAAFEQAGLGDFQAMVGGGSEPEFACGGLGEQLALRASIDGRVDTPEEIAIGEAAANLCIDSMGPVGSRLHSEYVARDMDEIRKALGAEQVSYLGFSSYGSALGVWYATLFPGSVRAMAVDGASNPFPFDQEEDDADELAEFAVRLEAALTACADPECPIYNDGDPVGYFRQAIAKTDLINAAANHPSAGFYGVISATFNEEDWPDLWQGLHELNENDDPSILLEYARQRSEIRELGANFLSHVNCLDQWVLDPEGQLARYTRRLDRATEQQDDRATGKDDGIAADATVAEMLASIDVSIPDVCPFYHQFAPEPLGEAFYGGGVPILVVGNHDDPRTSFRESEEVATKVLSNGYLVETSHYKHIAYPENQCVNDHVHRALIDRVYPGARRVFCAEDRSAAPVTAPEPEPAVAGERIDWSLCESGLGLQCGFVAVPADYRDPEAGSIRIAVNVHRATSQENRIGYLLVNPGGPGGSGLETVQGVPTGRYPHKLVSHFDIVGFDPRGVGASQPDFACGGLGEQNALLGAIDGDVDTPEEIAAGEAAASLCIDSMGQVGGRLHSEYVARDMDEIRQALGAEQVSYLGFSYGSALGVWYATLFPDSVRAMVVDGAANPFPSDQEEDEEDEDEEDGDAAWEALLEQALAACVDPECPIYNDGDPVGYYRQAVAKLDLVIAAADNNPNAGRWGVITTLYSEQLWPYLWWGLWNLNENDDPSILLVFAEIQVSGGKFGEASFTIHVNCLDLWVLYPELDRAPSLDDTTDDATADETPSAEKFPLITLLEVSFPNPCSFHYQLAAESLEGPFDGGGVPILVVGNHSDPATPFRESEELATEVLSNGYLLETDHFQHVVYPGNRCVNRHVHRALIDNERPGERRVLCEREDGAADSNR